MNKVVRFAPQIFFRVFIGILSAIFILALFSLFIFSYEYRQQLAANQIQFWQLVANSKAIWYFILGALVASVWLALLVSFPLGRVVAKARRISSRKWARLIRDDEHLYEEEVAEFYLLERALDKLGRKLSRNKDNLQQLREEVGAFMASIDEGIVSIDLNRQVMFYNEQFASDFISAHRRNGRLALTDIIRVPDILELFEEVLKTSLAASKVVKIRTLMHEGDRFYRVSVTPLERGKTGEVYGMIGVFSDVTEIKKTALIREDFVTNASHELRTPLTSIQGFLDTMNEDFKRGDYGNAPAFLDVVIRNVSRLQSLVEDLLTLAQLEAKTQNDRENVDPVSVTQNIVTSLAYLAKQKEQAIFIKGNDGLNLQSNPRQLEQVITNLLSNAIKYSPAHSRIDLTWEREPNEIVFTVSDQGSGIAQEHQSRLFERFYRVDPGRSREYGGTGLGLSIVKHVMVNHGGSVAIQSDAGKGSQFICRFPV